MVDSQRDRSLPASPIDLMRRLANDDNLTESIGPRELSALLDVATTHGVIAVVRDRLISKGIVDDDARTQLLIESAQSAATHLRAVADLDTTARSLEGAGLRWLVMKGPANAALIWPRPELREYTDLDVVIHPSDVAAALDALEESGFEVLEHNWTMLLERRRGQVHLLGPHTTLVDLHWDLIAEGSLRSRFRIDTVRMLERSEPAMIDRTPVRVFHPVDRMLHLGLHGALSGGHRLIWLKDIEMAILAGVDWPSVIDRANQFRMGPLLWLMLTRTDQVIGSGVVPRSVVETLRPPAPWRQFVVRLDRRGVLHAEDASLTKTIGRSSRATSSESWAALLRSGMSWGTARLRRTGANDLTDPSNPGSMLFASGGASDRERYLEWVADQAPPTTKDPTDDR